MKNLKRTIMIIMVIICTILATGCTKSNKTDGYICKINDYYDFSQIAINNTLICIPDGVHSIEYKKGDNQIILNDNTYISVLDKDKKYYQKSKEPICTKKMKDVNVYMEGNGYLINYVKNHLKEVNNYVFKGVYENNELVAHDFSEIKGLDIKTLYAAENNCKEKIESRYNFRLGDRTEELYGYVEIYYGKYKIKIDVPANTKKVETGTNYVIFDDSKIAIVPRSKIIRTQLIKNLNDEIKVVGTGEHPKPIRDALKSASFEILMGF